VPGEKSRILSYLAGLRVAVLHAQDTDEALAVDVLEDVPVVHFAFTRFATSTAAFAFFNS
jgi:hypothetical protein